MKKALNTLNNLIYPLTALCLFIVLWAACAAAAGRPIILPYPKDAFKKLFALLGQGEFYAAVRATLWRSLASFFYAFAAALALAAAGGLFLPLHKALSPVITILRSVPTMSIILLALIWLRSAAAPVLIAFLIVFPSMYSAFYGEVVSADKGVAEMSKVYKVSLNDRLLKFYIPSAAPAVFASAKSNISLNLKIVIASEVLAQTYGSVGLYMQQANAYLDTASLMAWTVAAVVLSFLLELFVSLVKKLCVRWPS